jgi:hypothetical protein
MARCCADLLVGGAGSGRSAPAWNQVYRALEHGMAKNACKDQGMMKKFPKGIEDFGNMFVTMQAKRHKADYDPHGVFYKSAVIQDISATENAIAAFRSAPTADKRAFAVFVLCKPRPRD